jgi:PAS domain S-box-containing protein
MFQVPENQKPTHELTELVEFTRFVLRNYFEEFLTTSYQLLREYEVPLLRSLPEDEARDLANTSNRELLEAFANNNPQDHIRKAIGRWQEDQFPRVEQNEMVVEDVMRISQVRKRAFLKFLPLYTTDAEKIIAIVEEIDRYIFSYGTTTLRNFVRIIDDRIKHHLNRLEESELLYKKAEAIASIGNWRWEVVSDRVVWTDEMYRIFGLQPQSAEINFHRYLELVHPDDRDLVTSHVTNSLRTKQPYEFFHRIVHNNGKQKILHARGEVVTDKQGKVVQLIGSAQDVTALKETERQLLENEQILLHRSHELQQSNASLEEFAYVASHDLKEPLRKITIFIDRLEGLKKKCTAPELDLLNRISSSVVRMRRMIDDLLDLSLISSEKKPQHVSLKKIFEECLIVFETKIEETHATVLADGLPMARVVPSQFSQLFHNLIGNALKFARPGVPPVIKVSFRYLYAAEVSQYNIQLASRYLEITFADNGIGFDNSFGEKIFGVFQRLHNRHEYEGTGIGLAICRKIAKNHGGTVVGEGVIGEGAKFKVIIPV